MGRHSVYVCTNISCSLRGADALLAAIGEAAAGDEEDFNVRSFECLGACDIAPMASVDGVYVGPLSIDDVPQLLDDARAGRPVLPDKQLATRLVADPHANSQRVPRARRSRKGSRDDRHAAVQGHRRARAEHAAPCTKRAAATSRCAKRLKMTPADVLAQLEASGLRGRGGAGFQMGKKVSFLPQGSMNKYLVCNADESEPGTFKDRELMQKNPHLLIEGIVIAAHAAGADRSFIYIRGEYVLQADILEAALAEAREAGYLGERILGSEHSLLAGRCTAAPARTSAARRPGCWTRWKASAATRA